jgi:hypothetical protein
LPEIHSSVCLLLFRYGIRGLVIDPYNELDHSRPPHMQETNFISSMLSKVCHVCGRHFPLSYVSLIRLVSCSFLQRGKVQNTFILTQPDSLALINTVNLDQ